MQKPNTFKAFVLIALLLAIAGCDASPEASKNKTNENSQPASGEKAGSTSEATNKQDNNNSNGATAVNSNSSANADNSNNSGGETSTGETVVTHDGFGKIKIGMTVAQASQAFGTELIAPNGKGECYYVEPKQGFKGVDFMVIEGKIARFDIQNGAYATDKGAKIGDTEAKIKSLYNGIEVLPQKYDEKRHDMEIYSPDKKYLMIFETDGKVVTGFRAGRAEEAGWVERCG